MAAIRSDKGKLLLDFQWQNQRCREYLGLDDDKEGRARAKHVQKIIEGELAAGTFAYGVHFPDSRKAKTIFAPPPPAPAGPPQFSVFAREWLSRQRGSVAYLSDLGSLIETHLVPSFGDLLMSEITLEHVEEFMVALRKKGLGGVRANKARALLSRIAQRGVRNKWLEGNPVGEVRREREPKPQIDPLTFEELRRLLDALADDPEMQRFYIVAAFSGLRTSELLALRWHDVDWKAEHPVATICQASTKLDGVHQTKTAGSERTIDLRPAVVEALKRQRSASLLKSEFVFPSETGGPLDRDNLANRIWYPALKRAGLRRRTPYQTRHSFATLALEAGESIGWIAQQLGHVDTAMVIKHYYRWVKNPARQDGSLFDKKASEAGL